MRIKWTLLFVVIVFFQLQTEAKTKYEFSLLNRTSSNRQLSSLEQEPMLIYTNYDQNGKISVQKTTAADWKKFKVGHRWADLFQAYSANTRNLSTNDQFHDSCFVGDPIELVESFFNERIEIKFVSRIFASTSSDHKMIGIEFEFQNENDGNKAMSGVAHFRLPHCLYGGKNAIVEPEQLKSASHRKFTADREPAAQAVGEINAAEPEQGFSMFDRLRSEDRVKANSLKLKRFELQADYDDMAKADSTKLPWRIGKFDLSTTKGAKDFSKSLIEYFYSSMIQNENDPNDNFNAKNIPQDRTQWCHMPWLNVGEAGREYVHGLTKERDLKYSKIYPAAGKPETEGSDWGVGYYNEIGCRQIAKTFGSNGSALASPNTQSVHFADGTISVKILFTTSKLPALDGAFSWTANVSTPGSTIRKLTEVKLVQMDIAVKDSALIGARKESDHWVMTTFYYDKSYKEYLSSTRLKVPKGFEGLFRMRPVGIQTGFDQSTSMIFAGSATNNNSGLMNGPADNTKASCMGCHAAAGTTTPFVPGVLDNSQYANLRSSAMDFSMQLGLAKRNFETRSGHIKK